MENRKLFFAILSFLPILVIFTNLNYVYSPVIGTAASITYFSVNGAFLGRFFLKKERLFFRLIFGILLLIILLGFVGWLVLIAYNLDIIRSIITLCTVSALSTFMGLRTRSTHWNLRLRTRISWKTLTRLGIVRLFYLLMITVSFCSLLLSRSREVHTVWEVMNPAFLPMFFVTTLLLLIIIFSSEKGEYKLMFIAIHSILSHSLFVTIFPAGDIGYQATILARTRLVFNNVFLHGWPPRPVEGILRQIWYLFGGVNFQASLSVIFARMFNVDIFWSHSFLVPVLWGIFTPVATFKITKKIGANENISCLSGLMVSVFPSLIYYGAISVPNTLGYIFFLFSLFFMMKYLSSHEQMNLFLTAAFSFASFMSHYLTGAMAFTLFLLAIALRKYKNEKDKSPVSAKLLLLLSFIFCTSIIPFALIYQRLFYPFNTCFSLDKLQGLAFGEIVQWFILGEYINYGLMSRIFHIIPPFVSFLGMIYYLKCSLKQSKKGKHFLYSLFLLLSFSIVLIDYRIIKLFMTEVPFNEERLWVFRDLIAVPFVAIIIGRFFSLLLKKSSNTIKKIRFQHLLTFLTKSNLKSVASYFLALIFISSHIMVLLAIPTGITISIYCGYPRYGPLQVTSYELEAVKYIDEKTQEKYVVIADYWMIIAGQMLVGVHNPNAYYFSGRNPQGVALFIEMKKNPTNETMIEAMKINNAATSYFIIGKPRLGEEEYSRIKLQAQQNNLPICKIFYYKGEEKLTIFYYKKPSSTE